MIDRSHIYGFQVVQPYKIVHFSKVERIKRAIVNKNFKLLFVKSIKVSNIGVSTLNVVA